jgi:hypothetical protein
MFPKKQPKVKKKKKIEKPKNPDEEEEYQPHLHIAPIGGATGIFDR